MSREAKSRTTRISLLVVGLIVQMFAIVVPSGAAAARPQTTITSGPSALIASRSATFRFRASVHAATFECRLDSKAWRECTSPKRYGSLAQGDHTFRVRASNKGATDKTAAARSFTVDTKKPATTLVPPSTFFDRFIAEGPTLEFSSSEPGTFECRLNASVAFTVCSSPFVPDALPDHIYDFEVRARDLAGNADATPASYRFSRITVMPWTQEMGEEIGRYFLPDQLVIDVPASCGGNPAIDCPGGTPQPPADQVSIGSTRAIAKIQGQNRFDMTGTLTVATLQPIKVSFSGANCDLNLNSANGSSPTWTLSVPLNLVVHNVYQERYISNGDGSLTGIEDDDWSLTGSFICQLGDSMSSGQIGDFLTDAAMGAWLPTCMAPGPALFETCPWVFDPDA